MSSSCTGGHEHYLLRAGGTAYVIELYRETVEIGEATTAPRRRLPFDALYDRVRAFLERTMAPSVFLE